MESQAVTFVFALAVIVFSVVLHEVSHGWVARHLGDDTAERAGRLTLNPIPHLDPVGSVLLPVLGAVSGFPVVAWAKPVPYNPANLWKDRQYGEAKVALAGPATNLALLLAFGLAARFLVGVASPELVAGLVFVAFVNASLGIFNLIPIPPLDGTKLVGIVSPSLGERLERVGFGGIALVFLLVFLAGGYIVRFAISLATLVASPEAVAAFAAVW